MAVGFGRVFGQTPDEGVPFDVNGFVEDEDLVPVDLEPVSCRDTDPVPGLARERDTIPCPPPADMDVVIDLLCDEDDFAC